jgi:hypothetical protein
MALMLLSCALGVRLLWPLGFGGREMGGAGVAGGVRVLARPFLRRARSSLPLSRPRKKAKTRAELCPIRLTQLTWSALASCVEQAHFRAIQLRAPARKGRGSEERERERERTQVVLPRSSQGSLLVRKAALTTPALGMFRRALRPGGRRRSGSPPVREDRTGGVWAARRR